MVTASNESFLAQYEALEGRFSDPMKLAAERKQVMDDWLFKRPIEMLKELLAKRPIFQIPACGVLPAITFVTKHKDVIEVLERSAIFSVRKYEEKMRQPRGPFVLGMADGDQYRKELEILRQVLPRQDMAPAITSTVKQIVDKIFDGIPPKGRLDIVEDVAWAVPVRLNILYFGLTGKDEKTLKRWFRDIYTDLFLNLRGEAKWTQKADQAVLEMNEYLAQLLAQPQGDTVAGRLMQREAELGKEGVRRNLFGLTVGVVETCLKAIARTVDQFLRRPDALRAAQAAANQGEAQTVLDYAFEVMRFNPQNHVLFRWCEQDCTIAEQSDRAMRIPQNSLVFAATLTAMFDPDVFPDPEKFDRKRPKENYLFFGHGLHECLGRYIGPLVLQTVFMRLLRLENLRRAPTDPFDPVDILPDHFLVDYGPADS